MKRLAPSAATAAAVKRPALAASAPAAAPAQPLMPADDPNLKFHENWAKRYPQYTRKVHEQVQQLLAEVGNVPDELALSDKDAKAKEYFDTGAEINIQRQQHEGKQMAMLQMFDYLPQQEDMDNFEKYVNAAQKVFDRMAPGTPNPFLPYVTNLKDKINGCWGVFREIMSTNEPVPIMHPDYRIELMGTKQSNPQAIVDYAEFIVKTFGEADCPNAARFIKHHRKIIPNVVPAAAPAKKPRATKDKPAPKPPTAPPAPKAPAAPVAPAPAGGVAALAAAAAALRNRLVTHKSKQVKAAQTFQTQIKDAVFAALKEAEKTPDLAKDDEYYYWNKAYAAATAVADSLYPDDDAKKEEVDKLTGDLFDEYFKKPDAGAGAGDDAASTEVSEEEEEEEDDEEDDTVAEGAKDDE